MECAGAPNTGKTWSCWRDEHTKTSSKNHPESLHHPTHPGFGFICLFMGVLKHCRELKTAQGLKPSGTVCAPSEIKWLQGLGDDFFFFFVKIPFVSTVSTRITTALAVKITLGQDITFLFSCLAKKPCWKLFSPFSPSYTCLYL